MDSKPLKNSEQIGPNRKTGVKGEECALKWLENRKFKIIYSHGGKASNKPYDIICSKDNKYYALDVKSGKSPQISLTSLKKLLNKDIAEYRKETKKPDLKKIDNIGYIFVVDNKCLLFDFRKQSYKAYKAWDTIRTDN